MECLLALFLLLGVLLVFFIGLGTLLRWIVNANSSKSKEPGRVYLPDPQRTAVLALLRRVHAHPEPLEAIEVAIAAIESTPHIALDLLSGGAPATQEEGPLVVHEPDSIEQRPSRAVEQPIAAADSSPASLMAEKGATTRSFHQVARNWLALDNITLLLYLGAALVVIAVGVFVGSSWDAIGGLLRWGVVAAFAVAFLVVGEGLRRIKPVLVRAGETFRSVGIVLMPFVAVAYDRFVLDGTAPPLYWLLSSIALAALYYGLYYWTTASRLPLYLGGLSLGVAASLVPDLFALADAWRASLLLASSGALLGIAWLSDPLALRHLKRLRERKVSVLAETHLLIGALSVAASWFQLLLFTLGQPLPLTVYLLLHTLLLVALALWSRNALFVGGAAVTSGLLTISVADLLFDGPRMVTWGLVIGWNLVAWVLFLLGPKVESRIRWGERVLAATALGWSGVAFLITLVVASASAADISEGVGASHIAVASYALVTMLVASARHFRMGLLLWPALVVFHIAVFATLALIPSDSPSLVTPTAIWLGLAGLWLAAERRLPAWTSSFSRAAFIAEAGWVLFFSFFDSAAAVVGGLLLVALWLQWARMHASTMGVAVSLAHAVYALFAVANHFGLPFEAVSFLTLALGTLLVLLARRLPDYAYRPADVGGLLLLLIAPLAGVIAIDLYDAETRWLLPEVASQLTLAISTGFYIWLALRRRGDVVTLTATALAYLFIGWLTVDYLPVETAPLVTLAAALLTLWVAPRAPRESGPLLDLLGLSVAFVAPVAGFLGELSGMASRELFGLGVAQIGQLTLLLAALLFFARGWQNRPRWLIAVSGFQLYTLYAWLALQNDVTVTQAYSVPLALLLFGLTWFFPKQREALEAASALALLAPAAVQSIAEATLFYSLLLGLWGLILVMVGISFRRRIPLVAGSAALLLAALRQLWEVATALPPGIVIGVVGVSVMALAVLLTLYRDTLSHLHDRGTDLWEQLGHE